MQISCRDTKHLVTAIPHVYWPAKRDPSRKLQRVSSPARWKNPHFSLVVARQISAVLTTTKCVTVYHVHTVEAFEMCLKLYTGVRHRSLVFNQKCLLLASSAAQQNQLRPLCAKSISEIRLEGRRVYNNRLLSLKNLLGFAVRRQRGGEPGRRADEDEKDDDTLTFL